MKLAGFDAAAKIKVIKEVRSITALGLKEAKELVSSCPPLQYRLATMNFLKKPSEGIQHACSGLVELLQS